MTCLQYCECFNAKRGYRDPDDPRLDISDISLRSDQNWFLFEETCLLPCTVEFTRELNQGTDINRKTRLPYRSIKLLFKNYYLII